MPAHRADLPARLLRLLSLLQSRREWPGTRLAGELGVTSRTLRRDVARLRALGYPVTGTTGIAGGYRLASGRNLPPLLLDDAEAVAIAVGLATAAASGVDGIGEDAMRALAKLERVLPPRLRPQLTALGGAASALTRPDAPGADPETLTVLAAACHDRQLVSFDYRDRGGAAGLRRVEPYHLVLAQARWYLLAWDPDRDDWRTFRVDRLTDPRPTGREFAPRALPAPDPASYVRRSFATASYPHRATIEVGLPAGAVRAGVFARIPGEIEDRPDGCTVRLSADTPALVVQYVAAIAALGAPVHVTATDEVAERLRGLGDALQP